MHTFQLTLVHGLARLNPSVMRTVWGWPAAQSLHFIGLTLMVGTIGVFDLRLLGIGQRIPIRALHRLIPWGLLGYGVNLVSGALFLMSAPDQYIYNPAFQLKMLFMAVAGLNASAFYLTAYRPATAPNAPDSAPRSAKVIAVVSLACWLGVIACGRLLAFYRPVPCGAVPTPAVADCILR